LLGVFLGAAALHTQAAGVTFITHGLNGNVTDWVIPMANKIPQHPAFHGTNASVYQISLTSSNSTYYLTSTFLDGVAPLTSDSGEIILAFDWSTLSGLLQPSTSIIAAQAVAALLATNLIADLGGHALVEMPLHLVGHSRGASVVAEMARLLGAQGLWVDETSTLDPYPLSLNGDPAMKNYANVFYADNFWQNIDAPSGQSLPGAYNRHLTNLSGGYPAGSSHSDVHLWYHGTVDLNTPAMDNLAMITAAERANWWTTAEAAGTNTGFHLSLIGGGDRLSTLEPNGAGNGRINDGFNRYWDLGAGVTTNRSPLPADTGAWPNLLRVSLNTTNAGIGQPLSVSWYHQFGSNTSPSATVRLSLDRDLNPYNGNELLLGQTNITGTGTNSVLAKSVSFASDPATTPPGNYWLVARITDGTHTRFMYAPQRLTLTGNLQPPTLVAQGFSGGSFRFTVSGAPGQTIVILTSPDLAAWTPVLTNTLTNASWTVTDPAAGSLPQRYYRASAVP
jgi:hypothetical protein